MNPTTMAKQVIARQMSAIGASAPSPAFCAIAAIGDSPSATLSITAGSAGTLISVATTATPPTIIGTVVINLGIVRIGSLVSSAVAALDSNPTKKVVDSTMPKMNTLIEKSVKVNWPA